MVNQHNKRGRAIAAAAMAVGVLGCSTESNVPAAIPHYDPVTRQLSRVTVTDAPGFDRAEAHVKDGRIARIDVDGDGDGRIDRWEYYSGHQLERIGISRTSASEPDTWVVLDATGHAVARVETAPAAGGRVTRTEFHEAGELRRAEEDTNLDGRVDKWEEYESGVLVRAGFDTKQTGKPTVFVDYRR